MDEFQDLQTVMDAVLKIQREQAYAQNTLQSGVNLIYIRDFLGHSDCSRPRFLSGLTVR
jgi:hypothetical protein